MTNQRIAVIGGTGRVGGLVIRAALDRGLRVAALARDPQRVPAELTRDPAVELVAGELADLDAIGKVVESCDAVVVAVGVRYRGGNPWRGLDGPADVVPTAVGTLIAAAPAQTPIVLLSAFGAGSSWQQLPWIARAVIGTSALKQSYAGLGHAEALLQGSGRPHTVVRAVTLKDRPSCGRSVDATGVALRGNPTVARVDVVGLLVDAALAPITGQVLVAAEVSAGR